jgi:hypothetical protein
VENREVQSTIIIAGFLLSFIFNLVAAVIILVLLLRKQGGQVRPAWLFTINFLCFIFQLYFLLK